MIVACFSFSFFGEQGDPADVIDVSYYTKITFKSLSCWAIIWALCEVGNVCWFAEINYNFHLHLEKHLVTSHLAPHVHFVSKPIYCPIKYLLTFLLSLRRLSIKLLVIPFSKWLLSVFDFFKTIKQLTQKNRLTNCTRSRNKSTQSSRKQFHNVSDYLRSKKIKVSYIRWLKMIARAKAESQRAKVYIAEFITAEIFNVSGLGEKRQAPSRPKTAESIFHSLWPRAKASGPRGICLIFPS